MAKIVFFGTPFFAREVLECVAKIHQIVAIVTQPDRPVGRKQELKPSEVKEYALLHNISLFQPEKLEDNLLVQLQGFEVDFFLVVAFGQIFPKSFLESSICINLHASILPQLRGASPLQEMILQDQKQFGISAMKMEEGLDCGEILGMHLLKTEQDFTLSALSHQLAQMGGRLANFVLSHYKMLAPLQQNHCESTLCKKIKKQDGEVTFENARKIFVKYLAFTPWPSIFLSNGLKLSNIAIECLDHQYQEGQILAIERDYVVVGCKQGSLRIYEVQPPSKQKMQTLNYLRGKHLQVGDFFC